MQIYDRIIYGIWVVGSYVYKGEKCEMPLWGILPNRWWDECMKAQIILKEAG